ncbi:uncharacterized protein LOC135462721 [Liolophura sinensis]|uniref:uncharacterized protein LOC135462721 n=1 Tax=Liolophura sinensis TaxID=3198878 RepID=UPI00315987EC
MSSNAPPTQGKTFGFGMVAFKKFPELIPLAVIIGGACVMCGSFMAYAIATKPDVRVVKGSELPPHERLKPEQSTKLVTINQKYEAIPELEQLRKEIGSFKP